MPSWNAAGRSPPATRPTRSPTWSCATPASSENATTCSPQPHPRLHELHKHQTRRLVLYVHAVSLSAVYAAQVRVESSQTARVLSGAGRWTATGTATDLSG